MRACPRRDTSGAGGLVEVKTLVVVKMRVWAGLSTAWLGVCGAWEKRMWERHKTRVGKGVNGGARLTTEEE